MATKRMTELRKCIGSAKYSIEPHEAPVEDFPKQPSQKDGLGRMCRTHWNQYTAALSRDRKARLAAASDAVPAQAEAEAETPPQPEPPNAKRGRRRAKPAAEAEQEVAAE